MAEHRIRRRVAATHSGTLLATAWYALCSTVAFGATAAAFVSLSPLRGSIHTVALAPGSTPLQVAGALVPVPLAYVGLGMVRLYLTALPAGFLLAGLIGAVALDRGGTAVAAVGGVAAAATVTVVTGCHCGAGEATALALKAV